jgi:hypothetical protein
MPEHHAWSGRGRNLPCMIAVSTRCRWKVSFTPKPLCHQKGSRVPIKGEADRAPQPVWTWWRHYLQRNLSLYWLGSPCCHRLWGSVWRSRNDDYKPAWHLRSSQQWRWWRWSSRLWRPASRDSMFLQKVGTHLKVSMVSQSRTPEHNRDTV